MRAFLAFLLALTLAAPASAQTLNVPVPVADVLSTFAALAVPIGGATGDAATKINIPPSITKYRINGVQVYNCPSAPAGTPSVNLWTGAGGTGTQIGAFSSANLTANTTNATLTGGTASANLLVVTSAPTIFVNVVAAASSPVSCTFAVSLIDLTGL